MALLELIGKRVDVELERNDGFEGLALNGTLIRAFEPPFHPHFASLGFMIGPHYVRLRTDGVSRVIHKKQQGEGGQTTSIHVRLHNNDALHIKPT